jgi:hypothetical protein
MIEVLLEAERALSVGMLDKAERLYRQAAANDARNAIAIVGLAKVALERDDELAALALGEQALAIDRDNVAARRLVGRLLEVRAHRGAAMGGPPPAGATLAGDTTPGEDLGLAAGGPPPAALAPPAPAEPVAPPRRGLLRRLFGRR